MPTNAIPVDLSQHVEGYVVNCGISKKLYQPIQSIQQKVSNTFSGAIWAPAHRSLHITMFDWLAPLFDYGQSKSDLFGTIERPYIHVLEEIVKAQPAIPVTFNTIEVFPAGIIAKGQDDGTFARIRKEFLEKVELLPGTKPPPKIIHMTICRFLRPINLAEVQESLRGETLHVQETISTLRLVKEKQIFMRDFEVLRQFDLLH